MAPTLANSYKVEDTAAATTALVTAAFTPAAGELLVVKIVCGDADQTIGTLAVTGFTLVSAFASRVNVGTTGSGCRAAIFTAFVNASASGTVSSGTFVNTQPRGMCVERWTNAQLAGTPATASILVDTAAPYTQTITTAANGSVLSYTMADWSGTSPAGAAFVGDTATPTQEQAATNSAGNVTGYWLYQAAATAGSQTWGMSAPSSASNYTGACIEIQDAGGGGTNADAILGYGRTDVLVHG